uniref:Uncharacterized protein n=1 Tax=Acyrthosiphon pisum TaxID=7029 RepID=C4WX02_ACYPI|nr:hypothetical protein [Acyrthosiphon pisum]
MYPECIIKLSGIPSVYVTGCHTDLPEVVPWRGLQRPCDDVLFAYNFNIIIIHWYNIHIIVVIGRALPRIHVKYLGCYTRKKINALRLCIYHIDRYIIFYYNSLLSYNITSQEVYLHVLYNILYRYIMIFIK